MQRVVTPIRRRRQQHRRRRFDVGDDADVDAGQGFEEPLEIAGGEQRFGGDQVDRFEAGDARQQIEIRRPQPRPIGALIGHRDNHPPDRPRARLFEQTRAQAVLVERAVLREARFVGAERRHEKARLLQQPPRAAIDLRARFERAADQPLEVVDAAMLAPQRVVERQHLRNQAGADLERRRIAARHRIRRRALEQHLARVVVQQRRRIAQPIVEGAIQPATRHDLRPHARIRRDAAGPPDDTCRGDGVATPTTASSSADGCHCSTSHSSSSERRS